MGNQAKELEAVYAQMMDGELLDIASDMDNLTDVARPLLQAELAKRRLELGEQFAVDPEVLPSPEAESEDVPLAAIPDYEGKCPKCGSLDIVFLSRDDVTDSEPHLQGDFHWVCDACQYEWSDDGLAAQ